MPYVRVAAAPWIAAAIVLAVLNLVIVLGRNEPEALEQAALLIGLGATLTAAGLVSARSSRVRRAREREERARPAAEELIDPPTDADATSYVHGMERWIAAVLELLDHAISVVEPDTPACTELLAAKAEASDLRELFDVDSAEELTINDHARLHAIGTLWEAGIPALELVAADVDGPWHRRWRARTVVERRLRHGRSTPRPLVLPYRI